jgi:hypothetical protein
MLNEERERMDTSKNKLSSKVAGIKCKSFDELSC